MKKIYISLSNINLLHLCAVIVGLMISASSHLCAQGRSIPRSSEAQVETVVEDAELPEGVKYRYPLLNGLSVMFNLYEPVMNLLGNDRASYEASVMLNIHHRFFPEATLGMGWCNELSDDLVRYHVKAAPFAKIGLRYNLKYNDLEDKFYYFIVARYGFCHSEADISNLTYTDGYWPEYGPTNIRNQKFNSHWVEVGGGIKVQIWKRLSAGWDVYIKPFLHKGSTSQATPYYVPGYGTTDGAFGMAFRLYYDLF